MVPLLARGLGSTAMPAIGGTVLAHRPSALWHFRPAKSNVAADIGVSCPWHDPCSYRWHGFASWHDQPAVRFLELGSVERDKRRDPIGCSAPHAWLRHGKKGEPPVARLRQ